LIIPTTFPSSNQETTRVSRLQRDTDLKKSRVVAQSGHSAKLSGPRRVPPPAAVLAMPAVLFSSAPITAGRVVLANCVLVERINTDVLALRVVLLLRALSPLAVLLEPVELYKGEVTAGRVATLVAFECPETDCSVGVAGVLA